MFDDAHRVERLDYVFSASVWQLPITDQDAKTTGREIVGKVTRSQLRDIAEKKMKDLNANDIEAAARIIEGSARAMGLSVVEN